jgi:hypothetical protein
VRDLEIRSQHLQYPEQLIDGHPLAHRALLERVDHRPSPRRQRGQVAAFGLLSLDDVDAAELVEQGRLLPLLPHLADHLGPRPIQRLAAGRRQL